ncbi:4184_t:CDS:2, partial [Funneliformis geosporum]
MPLKPKTTPQKNYNLLIGRHCLVKSPHFLLGAIQEALAYGANSLMFHIGAPQNSSRRALEELKIPEFKQILAENKVAENQVIVHGPYLINLANATNPKIFSWSVEFLKKELIRAEKIGSKTFVLHPGSTLKTPLPTALDQVVEGLDSVLQNEAQIRIALETMSGKGSEIGTAGYDIKDNLEAVIKEFEEKIGLEKLWVIHINDSLF